MRNLIRPAVVSLLLLILITGVIYPVVVTGLANAVFPRQAQGSLLMVDGKAVGSELIGQPFDDPKYFWSRPSGTSPAYNGAASAASNLAPGNADLATAIAKRVAALRAADPGNTAPVPIDLVTASGSGLDPHISVAAARYQAARVARVRHLDLAQVEHLIEQHTEPRTLNLLGEPHVNVVRLNLALDGQ